MHITIGAELYYALQEGIPYAEKVALVKEYQADDYIKIGAVGIGRIIRSVEKQPGRTESNGWVTFWLVWD